MVGPRSKETSRKRRLQQSTASDLFHQNLQVLNADKSIYILELTGPRINKHHPYGAESFVTGGTN
jgi:hypothetical protein